MDVGVGRQRGVIHAVDVLAGRDVERNLAFPLGEAEVAEGRQHAGVEVAHDVFQLDLQHLRPVQPPCAHGFERAAGIAGQFEIKAGGLVPIEQVLLIRPAVQPGDPVAFPSFGPVLEGEIHARIGDRRCEVEIRVGAPAFGGATVIQVAGDPDVAGVPDDLYRTERACQIEAEQRMAQQGNVDRRIQFADHAEQRRQPQIEPLCEFAQDVMEQRGAGFVAGEHQHLRALLNHRWL